jgi:hypothetical protein
LLGKTWNYLDTDRKVICSCISYSVLYSLCEHMHERN